MSLPGPEFTDDAPPARGLGSALRFVLSGGINTLLTYVLYLLLLESFGHRWSYGAAFAVGIVLAYVLNRAFVFRSHAGWRSAIAMPVIYLLQFCVGLGIVELWVVWLRWPAALAPLAATALTLPMTYLLSRQAFGR